jgi:hypothetical protein
LLAGRGAFATAMAGRPAWARSYASLPGAD